MIVTVMPVAAEDPYLWLEEVEGEQALEWVKAQNEKTLKKYRNRPEFQEIYDRALEILNSQEKLVYPSMIGDNVVNFWRDDKHERGLIRRMTLSGFLKGSKEWETVLDVDALAAEQEENWVYKGQFILAPEYRRSLVWLSRGGSDASVMREFDLQTKAFVEDGFNLPEAKSEVAWRDQDSLYVGTDFGEGSMTTSGYPRILKLWYRGTPLSEAKTLLEVKEEDLAVQAWVVRRPEGRHDFISRIIDFWNEEKYLVVGEELKKLPVPDDAPTESVFHGRLIVSLRSDWARPEGTFKAGSVLSLKIDELLAGTGEAELLHDPAQGGTVESVSGLADALVLTVTKDVKTGLTRHWLEGEVWKSEPIDIGSGGTTSMAGSSRSRNDFFCTYQDWLSPTTLTYLDGGKSRKLQSLPARFKADGLESQQHWATSKDGTRVPYYVIKRKDLELDGTAPTLLYGYGGFEISILPTYLSLVGPSWLQRGGVYVSANIRGGGEFGPTWHQAALREKRPRAYEDFEAVAEDIIAKGITSAKHLGVHGRSNGGLLTGAMLTRRPELFEAVLVGVPLLDMRRYSKLLAGASWMAEYGDPDKPEDWAFIKTWSPYHNIKADGEYPVPLIYTSTKDDRVHPGHARKMAARMMEMGFPVDYYENLEGGHAGASNNPQTAFFTALSYTYLLDRLKR